MKTYTNEEIQERINLTLLDFDFEKVRKVMLALDWKWHNKNSPPEVPSVARLYQSAESRLWSAYKCMGDREITTLCSGGFSAVCNRNEEDLWFELAFYVAESCSCDYQNEK